MSELGHIRGGESDTGRLDVDLDGLCAAFEAVPVPVIMIEDGTAAVIYANPAADRMAGGAFPRAHDAGAYDDAYLCTDDDGRRIPARLMPGVRTARGEDLERFEMDWHLPDGVRSLILSSRGVTLPDGTRVGVVVFEDVTGAQARARATAGVLDAVLDAVPVGVGHLDDDLRFVRVNAALAAMQGISPEDHVGRRPTDLLGEDGEAVESALAEVLESGRPLFGQTLVTDAMAGAPRRWRFAAFPLRSDTGERQGVGLTAEDVTARTTLLEAEREARARAEDAERRARFLARVSDELSRSLDLGTTMQTVASLAVPERAAWCAIDMLERDRLVRVATAHASPEKERLGRRLSERYPASPDQGALGEALRTRKAVVLPEVSDELLVEVAQDEEHLEILRGLEISGGIVVPLVARDMLLGALTFAFEGGRHPDDLDVQLAEDLGRRAAVAMDNSRLYRDRSIIARTLQDSLLPPRPPEVPGFTIATRFRPAGEGTEVGGDFYDVFQRSPDEWAVVIGDVCGKGVRAAALTALARWTIRAAVLRTPDPVAVLEELNTAVLHESGESDLRFMSAACAVVRLEESGATARVAVAGHPPLMHLRPDGSVTPIRAQGMLLGVATRLGLAETRVTLGTGEALVFVTDGVTEAGASVEPLGQEGLTEALASAAGDSATAIAAAVEEAARLRSPEGFRDDVAIVVLRHD